MKDILSHQRNLHNHCSHHNANSPVYSNHHYTENYRWGTSLPQRKKVVTHVFQMTIKLTLLQFSQTKHQNVCSDL